MGDSTDYLQWMNRCLSDVRYLKVAYESGLDGLENPFYYISHQATEKLLKATLVKFEEGRTLDETIEAYTYIIQILEVTALAISCPVDMDSLQIIT